MNILRIGLTVIIVFAFTGCEGRKNKYWYYSVEVDLLVEGKSERLIGFYECRHRGPQFHASEGPYSPTSRGYHPAKRLKSRAAVVVVPVYYCNARIPHSGEWIEFYDVEKYAGPRPRVYWLNDADHPTRIESYVSDIYYELDKRRVQLERFKVAIVSDGRAEPMKIPRPEHEAVESYGVENQRVWVAYYAIIVPKSLWSESAGFEEWLVEYNELSELRLKDPNDKNLFDQILKLTNFAPGRGYVYVRGKDSEFNTAADHTYEASRRLVPLLRRETRLRLSPRSNQNSGLLIYVPRDELESCAPPPQECVTFCIDGRCHNMNGQYGLYFDPVTETIFRMGLTYGRIVGVR